MGIFSRLPKACRGPSSFRASARLLLKGAARGDTTAFTRLAEVYFNLATEYLYLCNCDQEEAVKRATGILSEGWMRLPYLKRLEDWERFLACSLMDVEVSEGRSTEGRRPKALVGLGSRAKFALIAFDLENWSYRCLSEVLDIKEKELSRLLFRARCALLDLDLDGETRKIRHFLEDVSADLDGQLTPRQRRQMLRKLCGSAEGKEFKSHWLDYRCHLIEMRQQIRIQPEMRQSVLDQLSHQLSPEQMLHPPLLLRLRKLLFPSPAFQGPIIRGPRDLRYGDG